MKSDRSVRQVTPRTQPTAWTIINDDVRSPLTYPTAKMDVQKFIHQLSNFSENENPKTVQPKSDQFQQISQQVQARISVNFMQLLNWAVECLDPDEMYCEVGTQEGSSLIAALLGHPERMAYAVSDIANDNSLEQFIENVQCFDLEEQIIFCNQDFESFFLELREVEADTKIGVYYYQGLSDYRSVFMGLLLVQPYLANQAIILIHSADIKTIQQAIWDFMKVHPQCQILSNFYQILGTEITILSWNAESTSNYSAETFQDKQSQSVIQAIQNLKLTQPEVNLNQIYKTALHAHEQQQYELAEQNYKQFIQYHPSHAEAWHRLSILYYEV